MAKWIKAYRVKKLNKVDTTWYKDGDIFITDSSIGVLANGKIKTIGNETDLSEYVKHDDVVQLIDESIPDVSVFVKTSDLNGLIGTYLTANNYVTQSEVPDVSVFVKTSDLNGLIGTYLTANNYVTQSEVQAMIDEALKPEGE